MNRGNFSKTIPVILIVIIVIVAIAAIVSIGRSIFSGGGDSEVVEDRGTKALTSIDATRAVQMTVRGPIVANEQFNTYQIEVSPDDRVMTTYEGYLKSVVESEAYGNNMPAYEEFAYALHRADMMNERNISEEDADLRGVCATGNVYEFAVMQADRTIEKLWTSDCREAKGTLDADEEFLMELFTLQIPAAEELASEVELPY